MTSHTRVCSQVLLWKSEIDQKLAGVQQGFDCYVDNLKEFHGWLLDANMKLHEQRNLYAADDEDIPFDLVDE